MYPASPPALPILPNPHQHQLFSPPLPPRTALTPMLRTWRSCRVASCAQHPFVGPMGADDADTDVEQTTRNTNLLGLDEGGVLSLLPKLCTQSNDTGTSTTPSSLARQYRLCWASSEHAGVSSNSPQPTRASPPSTHTHPLLVVLAITPTCVSARTMYARALPQLQIQTRHPLPMRITRLTAVGSSGAYRGATPVSSSLGPNNESLSRTTLASSRLRQAPKPAPKNTTSRLAPRRRRGIRRSRASASGWRTKDAILRVWCWWVVLRRRSGGSMLLGRRPLTAGDYKAIVRVRAKQENAGRRMWSRGFIVGISKSNDKTRVALCGAHKAYGGG
ncbi:hypothetical protein C8F04DRAFT_1125037 [Mycena alexandri]|uniref:Uncharacterized protein n=1 Tax=Mycena alexandri TaxID=1745969 RepID=A0AAD6SFB4_9AGAR|nr:hypothetical protein C8F04DRAFT_1125037 [Mycena alexandri]